MNIRVWPKAAAGRLAVIFSLLFLALTALKISIPILLPTPFIAGLGIAGFLVGMIAVFKDRDRALLTPLSVIVGLLIILWAAAEIAFPH